MAQRLYLIDGHATLYRAYFAIKTRLSAPGTGAPTHAAFGFTKVLRSILEKNKPELLAVAMDSPWPTFRHDMYKEYKSSRPAMPEDLRPQIEMAERICEAYKIPVYRAQGFEADDVLGTLAEQASAKGLDVVIVSGDKDVLQLVRPPEKARGSISVFDPQTGELLDASGVEAKKGVPPEKMIDVFGLQGDASDDIPGVPGIGPKTAVELIRKYGSLEAVLEAAKAGKEKGKRGEMLVKHAEDALLSRKLATIRRDAPVTLNLEECRVGPGDQVKLMEVFRELGFRAFMSTLAPTAEREGDAVYLTIDTWEAFENFLKELGRQKRFALDLETDSEDPRRANIVGLSFSWEPKRASYIPVRGPDGDRTLEPSRVLKALSPILSDSSHKKVGQNAKYDMLVLRRAGVDLAGLEFDTMVAAYLLDPGTRSYNLDALALQYLGYRKIGIEEVMGKGKAQLTMDRVDVSKVARYSCEDADITWRLYRLLESKLQEMGLEKLYRELEHPLIEVLADIEWNGIAVDVEALKKLSEGMAETMKIEEEAVYEAAGRKFNISSPKQLEKILYDELKLPVLKKTKTGRSTDSEVLEELASKHELPRRILKYRELAKLKSTYADALPGYVNPQTGRIHASFHQTVTATGRLSTSDPNLQNIPVRSEQGRAIRQCFVAEQGRKLLSADYSQIELRILAHLSKDRRLVEAFRAGHDIHAAVASELYGVPIDSVTPEQRRRAKTVNFGLMYGQGAKQLANTTGMTVEEADKFISDYFHRFEGVKKLREEVIAHARAERKVETMLGRIRYLPEINSDDVSSRRAAERMAFNTVIQGSAADLIKRAMIDIYKDLRSRNMQTKMVLQIHDELLFEAPPEELQDLKALVKERMAGALKLDVPLVVDVGVGDNWLDLE